MSADAGRSARESAAVRRDGDQPDRPKRSRLAIALCAAVASALYVAWAQARVPGPGRDFDPLWIGARALFAGQDPWQAVADWGWRFPLYHPLPALLLVAPFAWLPLEAARVAFAAFSGGLLAFAACRTAWWPLLFLVSAPFRNALSEIQLAPVLTAAALMPMAGGLFAIKPSIGLALFLSRPRLATVIGGLAFLLISLAIRPSWPITWWTAAREVTHLAPVVRPGGALLLLALLRRRWPEGRLLIALALIPHRPVAYDMLPLLLLVPRKASELAVLVVGAELAWQAQLRVTPTLQIDVYDAASWPAFLAFVYIPALIFVLRRPRAVSGAESLSNEDGLKG